MPIICILLLALILAICATTYALVRLAPVDARPPRGALVLLRVARWLAKPQNASTTANFVCLAAFAGFAVWAFIFYPEIAITLAVLIGALAAVSYSRSTS